MTKKYFTSVLFFLFLFFLWAYHYLSWFGVHGAGLLFLAVALSISSSALLIDFYVRQYFRFGLIFVFSIFLFFVFFAFCFGGREYAVAQLLAFLIVFYYGRAGLSLHENAFLLYIFSMFHIFLIMGFWMYSGSVMHKPWVMPSLNPNVMAFSVMGSGLILVRMYGLFVKGKSLASVLFFLAMFCSGWLVYVSGARSTFVTILLIASLMLLFRVLKLKVNKFKCVFFIWMAFLLLPFVSYVYVDFYQSEYSAAVSEWLWSVTKKGLYTGREIIWSEMFSYIKENLVFGAGFGSSIDELGIDMSAHNLYLALLYQLGLVGYVLFLVLFTFIFSDVVFSHGWRVDIFSVVVLISVLVQQMFEIFLFQNNFPASSWFWLFLTMAGFKYKNQLGSYEANTSKHG